MTLRQSARPIAEAAAAAAAAAQGAADAAAAAAQGAADAALAAAAGVTPGRLWIPATAFHPVVGSPALTLTSAGFPAAWALDQSSDEGVGASVVPPESWVTFELDLYLRGLTGATGNVRMLTWYDADPYEDAAAVSVPFEVAHTAVTVASPGVAVRIASNVLGPVAVADHLPHQLLVRRNADDALDTLAADFGFVGVLLRGSAT